MRQFALIFSALLFTHLANAKEFASLFDGLADNAAKSVSGNNLWYWAAGFASTPLLISSGTDASVYESYRGIKSDFAVPGAALASGAGVFLAGGLFYLNTDDNDHKTLGADSAVAQSSLITVGYVLILKFATGRAHPTNSWHLNPQEQSQQWQFGFLRNGLTSYGWPSGHVAHTVAVTSALAHYYPNKKWLPWLSFGLSSYMLYTVVAYDRGQMHWLSDGVAGAFIGYAVGSTVGKNAKYKVDGEAPQSAKWFPVIAPGYAGIFWNW